MKKILSIISLAALTIGLLGSCKKDNSPETPKLPDGALSGEFSVSATKKVHFSKGNLWYGKVGDAQTATFQFESNQYEFHGYDSANNTWGLFGWVGASSPFTSSPEIYGATTSGKVNVDYGNVFDEPLKRDWGKTIDDKGTWSTLTKEEWCYLLAYDPEKTEFITTSPRYNLFKTGVKVCDTLSLVLAPDGYKGNIEESYNPTAWATAEADGFVCLPFTEFYRVTGILDNVPGGVYYWSSSSYPENTPAGISSYALYCSKNTGTNVMFYSFPRMAGCCVRLVTEVK